MSSPTKGPADWDARFAEPGFAYGDQPNRFLEASVAALAPGAAFTLCEGEGRNAVHLARRGFQVSAIDFSEVGRAKALALARRWGVRLDYALCDIADVDLGVGRWDLVVSIFSQPDAAVRQRLHRQMAAALRPGGHFVLESKAETEPDALRPDTRYPGVSRLCRELQGLRILLADEDEQDLDEGRCHAGRQRTARIVAIRD